MARIEPVFGDGRYFSKNEVKSQNTGVLRRFYREDRMA